MRGRLHRTLHRQSLAERSAGGKWWREGDLLFPPPDREDHGWKIILSIVLLDMKGLGGPHGPCGCGPDLWEGFSAGGNQNWNLLER